VDTEAATLHQLVAGTYAFLTGGCPEEPDTPTTPALAAWAQSIRACRLVQSADRQSDADRAQARTQARAELAAAEAVARHHGLHQLVLHCRTATALVAALEVDLEAMEQACTDVVGLARHHGWRRSPWLAMSHALRGLGALLHLEPANALRHATQAARVAGPTMPRSWRFLIGLVQGGARVDAGHRSDGLRLLRQARAELSGETVPVELVALGALVEHRAAVALGADSAVREFPAGVAARGEAAGELALMAAWTRRGTVEPPEQPLLGCLTQLEARLLEAAAAIRAGERTRARAALSTALRLAEPVRLIRPFEQADPALRQLLVDQIGGFGESESFASQVHRALSALDRGHGDALLTDREHMVLVALTSQRSLEEIAADLAVSVNTVKTHVRAIYSKLGAGSRRTAVLAARELGLT
jgi:LuxR family maltose regulon positive regulatory protein